MRRIHFPSMVMGIGLALAGMAIWKAQAQDQLPPPQSGTADVVLRLADIRSELAKIESWMSERHAVGITDVDGFLVRLWDDGTAERVSIGR